MRPTRNSNGVFEDGFIGTLTYVSPTKTSKIFPEDCSCYYYKPRAMLPRMSNPAIDHIAEVLRRVKIKLPGAGGLRGELHLAPEMSREIARTAIKALRAASERAYENYRCEKRWRDMNSTEVLNLWIDAVLKDT
jgi:hypothetical protein